MSQASVLSDLTDEYIQKLVGQCERLRITRIDLSYSFISSDFERVVKLFESAGFMIKINSQFANGYNITVSYMRNWGS